MFELLKFIICLFVFVALINSFRKRKRKRIEKENLKIIERIQQEEIIKNTDWKECIEKLTKRLNDENLKPGERRHLERCLKNARKQFEKHKIK